MQPGTKRPENHHIWNHNGTYFIHVTLLWNGRKKVRLRKSLKTKDVDVARTLRDHVLNQLRESPEMQLLIRE